MSIMLDRELAKIATPEMKGLEGLSVALSAALSRPAFGLVYSPTTRLMVLPHIKNDIGRFMVKDWNVSEVDGYKCKVDPFTGDLLPIELSKALNRVVLKERRQTVGTMNKRLDRTVPQEFVTSQWWMRRDLAEKVKTEKPDDPARVEFQEDAGIYRETPDGLLYREHYGHPPHMCWFMRSLIQDKRSTLYYNKIFRSYGIRDFDNRQDTMFFKSPRTLPIQYCPGCGTKLPKPLHSEWREAVDAAGFDPNDPALPERFLTDIWWQEAGL